VLMLVDMDDVLARFKPTLMDKLSERFPEDTRFSKVDRLYGISD
jgi:hypothetical protein